MEPVSDDDVLFEATRHLLDDVVHAAGGVERAVVRLREAMDSAQRSCDGDIQESGPLTGFSAPSIEDAWYSLEELLMWTRTLNERLQRRPFRGNDLQGLIPALAPGPLRDDVTRAHKSMKQETEEARSLSNLNLHMQASNASPTHADVRSGRLVIPFPDPVTGHVFHRWSMTFTQRRDALTVAEQLFGHVARFMEELIHAFEVHKPARLKG